MNSWDRLEHEGETAVAFAKFCRFRDAGPTRELRAVYRQATGKPQARQASGTWLQWATTFRWKARAEAWDREQDRIRQEAAKNAIQLVTEANIKAQYELSPSRTLRESAAIAFSHLGQAAEWRDGELILKDSKELPPEVLAAVCKVTVRKDKDGNVVQQSIEYHDKNEQIRNLGQNQRLWGEKDTESEVTQRNNFLIFIEMAKSGQLNALAWVLTLPVAMLLSESLFVLLRQFLR